MKKGFPDLIFLDTIFPVAVGKYPPRKAALIEKGFIWLSTLGYSPSLWGGQSRHAKQSHAGSAERREKMNVRMPMT